MKPGSNRRLLWVGDDIVLYDFYNRLLLVGSATAHDNPDGKFIKIENDMVKHDNEDNILVIGRKVVLYE